MTPIPEAIIEKDLRWPEPLQPINSTEEVLAMMALGDVFMKAQADEAKANGGSGSNKPPPAESMRSAKGGGDAAGPGEEAAAPLSQWTTEAWLAGRVATLRYHIAITACNSRNNWARVLANTLLSILTSGAQPESITVLWCEELGGDADSGGQAAQRRELPAVFGNMRYSSMVRVMYIPAALKSDVCAGLMKQSCGYLMALHMPAYLRSPDVPLLVLEDDTVLAPNFHNHLTAAWRMSHEAAAATEQGRSQAAAGSPTQELFLTLYEPTKVVPMKQAMEVHDQIKRQPDPNSFKLSVAQGWATFSYGAQGVMYSPGFVRSFADYLVTRVALLPTDWLKDHGINQKALPDILLLQFVTIFGSDEGLTLPKAAVRFNQTVMRKSLQASGLLPPTQPHAFKVSPSLVEHLGLSNTRGNEMKKFHQAKDFPFKVLFPHWEPANHWRRRLRGEEED